VPVAELSGHRGTTSHALHLTPTPRAARASNVTTRHLAIQFVCSLMHHQLPFQSRTPQEPLTYRYAVSCPHPVGPEQWSCAALLPFNCYQ
jgi:hypothetical protein